MIRYNTVSNKVRVIRTPGGEHRYLHIKKKGTSPKCGDCGIKLPGVCETQYGKPRRHGRRMGS
jgi:large subunit ribosomal protein L34e